MKVASGYAIEYIGYQTLFIDGVYLHVLSFNVVAESGENIGTKDIEVKLEGNIDDEVSNSSAIGEEGTVNKIGIHIDNDKLDVIYSEGDYDYDGVNYFSIQNDSTVSNTVEVIEKLQEIINNTINNSCGGSENFAECYYEIKTENLLFNYTGENPEFEGNTGVSYGPNSTINIRLKLKNHTTENTFKMKYKDIIFTCVKDGDMYADCSGIVEEGRDNIGVSSETPGVSQDRSQTIYIDSQAVTVSKLLHTPEIGRAFV